MDAPLYLTLKTTAMKKIFTLLVLLSAVFCLKPNKAEAQTPYVNLQYAGDSSWNYNCTIPDTVNMFFYGIAQGYSAGDSVMMQINFGDGTDTTYYLPLIQGATIYDFGLVHVYTNPGAYSAQFILTGSNGAADTMVDDAILIAAQCGDISGQLYIDANADCIFNTGDTPIQSYVSASYNGQGIQWAYSDSLGNYYMSVPDGFTYSVTMPYLNNLNIVCPNSGQYAVSTLPATGINFSLGCNSAADLTGNIYGQGFRNNSTTGVWVNAWNNIITCAPPTATVTIDLDPMLTYVSSYALPVSTTASQIVFNAGQLSGLNFTDFGTWLTLLTNINANLGDTLCLTMTIDPIVGDLDPSNNVITVCMPVRNSCDPNEKFESHAGATSTTVAPGTELNYTIMFQNVGNDVAYDINVIDELDANLDLSTLKITGASHDYAFYQTNNTLKFEFKDINLAAASVNEPLSHGYVSYSIMHKTGIALGTAIDNTAEIYFDFNAPIVTNTVTDIVNLTTVGLQSASSSKVLQLYPNPAQDYFKVSTHSTQPSLLTIYDVTGRNVNQVIEVSDDQKISTSNLNSGLYFISLVVDGITYTAKLAVK
ncbi:hypothetical protein BH11BAC2_BH11BAC2_10900 [soil metagenome]